MLTPEDQAEFRAAASALITSHEALQLRLLQDGPGPQPMSNAGARLTALMARLHSAHGLVAYRFRGHVFIVENDGQRVTGFTVLMDSAIENIEG